METPAEKVFMGEKIEKKPPRVCEKETSGTKPIFLTLWKIMYAIYRNHTFGLKGEEFVTGVEFPKVQHTGSGEVLPGPSPALS